MAIKLTGLNKSNLVKNLAKKYKYVTHLDRAIDKEEFEWSAEFKPKLGDDAWHPSGDCVPSLRELWLKATGQVWDRSLSVGLRKTFMVGHFWHAYLQHVTVENLGFCSWDEVERRGCTGWGDPPEDILVGDPRWKPYHWATGSADICPCEIPGHGPFLIDYKTMKSMDFNRNDPPAWAVDKWECQLNIYMDWFDMERAILVGINKDSPHDFKEFEFRRNQPLIDAIYLKWRIVSECLDEDVEVPEGEDIDLPLKGPVK